MAIRELFASDPSKEIGATIETITPEVAMDMLESGYEITNRKVSDQTVRRYAADMVEGRWQLSGEAIKFDRQGRLIDGQHRLWAVVQSGATIQSLVVRGVDVDAFAIMDTGKRRTAADFLAIHGYANASLLAALLTRILAYRRFGDFRQVNSPDRPRNEELLALARKHPELVDIAQVGRNHRYRPLAATASTLSALYFLFRQAEPDDAEMFFDLLSSGAGLEEGNPILVLRNTLIRMRENTKTHKVNQNLVAAFIIKAWNAWREGRVIHHLRFSPGGANAEPFPEIL